jgi:hypothetical protein
VVGEFTSDNAIHPYSLSRLVGGSFQQLQCTYPWEFALGKEGGFSHCLHLEGFVLAESRDGGHPRCLLINIRAKSAPFSRGMMRFDPIFESSS